MGLFGHKSEPTPAQAAPSRHSTSSDGSRLSSGSRRSGGFLHRNQEDPSISDARQRVASAEAAEREADRALVQARTAVRDAREHIKRIEMEAAEEYVILQSSCKSIATNMSQGSSCENQAAERQRYLQESQASWTTRPLLDDTHFEFEDDRR